MQDDQQPLQTNLSENMEKWPTTNTFKDNDDYRYKQNCLNRYDFIIRGGGLYPKNGLEKRRALGAATCTRTTLREEVMGWRKEEVKQDRQ